MPSQPPLRLGAEVDAAATILDLAELPLGVSLLQSAALMLRDAALERLINEQFAQLQSAIDDSITNSSVGHLIEVSLYVDGAGNVVVPSGQFVYSLGVGTEPLDALAEHLRKPQLRAAPPDPQWQNRSTFVWITRGSKSLEAATIAPEFRRNFFQLGFDEARRRDLLANWHRALPQDPHRSISVAQYWAEMANTRAHLIADAAARKEVADLANDMRELQVRTNELYHSYQDTVASMTRVSQFMRALGVVSSLASLFKSALDFHALVCTPDKAPAIGGDVPPEANQSHTVEVTLKDLMVTEKLRQERELHLRLNVDDLRRLDVKLEDLFRTGGIPLPHRAPFPVLP